MAVTSDLMSYQDRINLGWQYLSLEQHDKALEIVTSATPYTATNFYLIGLTHVSRGDHVQGLAAYEEALALEPRNVEIQVARGWCLHGMERFSESLEVAYEVIEQEPEFAEAWLLALSNYLQLESLDLAAQCADRWLALEITVDALNSAAHVAIRRERWGEARRYSDQALELDPVNPSSVATQADVLAYQAADKNIFNPTAYGDSRRAMKLYRRAIGMPGASPDLAHDSRVGIGLAAWRLALSWRTREFVLIFVLALVAAPFTHGAWFVVLLIPAMIGLPVRLWFRFRDPAVYSALRDLEIQVNTRPIYTWLVGATGYLALAAGIVLLIVSIT